MHDDGDGERPIPMKIFVGGLHQDTTVEGLNAYFSQFGPASAFIMRDGATNRSRGFGFVNFDDENTMNAVLQFQHQIDGMSVTCSPYDGTRSGGKGRGGGGDRHNISSRNSVVETPRALQDSDDEDAGLVDTPVETPRRALVETPRRPRVEVPRRSLVETPRSLGRSSHVSEPPPAELKLFIGGLSKDTTRDSLNAYFRVFDADVDCYVMKDGATGRSRGFAFANFRQEAAVNAVLQQDHLVDGVTINVSPYRKGGGGGVGPTGVTLPGRAERDAVPPLRSRGLPPPEGDEGILPATSRGGSERTRSLSALAVAQAILAHRHTMQAAQAQAKQAQAKQQARHHVREQAALPAFSSAVTAFDTGSEFDALVAEEAPLDDSIWNPDEALGENGELPPDWGASGGQDALLSTDALLVPEPDPLLDPLLSEPGLEEPGLEEQTEIPQEELQGAQVVAQLPPLEDPVLTPRIPPTELKIFVGGLSQETTKESLNAYFSNFGQVSSYVMLDGRTGRSRGFGFVNFESEDVMQTVLAHQHQVDGIIISCSPYKANNSQRSSQAATPRGGLYGPVSGTASGAQTPGQPRKSSTCKVFVADLSEGTTEDMLEEAFLAFQPNFVTVCKDSLGRSKGFGIIEFSSPSAAKEALLYCPIIDGMQTDVSEYWEKECAAARTPRPRSSPY